MSEEVLWKGSPSQVLNLGKYLLVLLLAIGIGVGGFFFFPIWAALIIPIIWAIWIYMQTRSIRTELTTERIRLEQGIFNRKLDDVELYRVKDTSMERPFWYRIFGLSTLVIETSDLSQPRIEIKAVSDGDTLRENLRKQVEMLRDKKRVREVDFDHMADSGGDHGDMGDHGGVA
ncbi:PH domain-containing protein [Haloferula sp. BvORR071]|uniref:PH domain-containing protein n=1 Tax=Haloferula sp. BvORR071 TaxID=1396141 RepID=UPI000696184B|nr:PH domain-containing protein [Haloferula sp. BvORR071]